MPGFDGTGPQGMGSMTGGARGYCNPAGVGYRSGFGVRMGLRRGFRGGGNYGMMGMRRCFGRGYGNQFAYDPYPMDDKAEIDMLKAEADTMKSELEMINKRIAEIEKSSAESFD